MDAAQQPVQTQSPADGKGPAVRKRSQIAQAGKTMFIWVAVASVIIGGALVVSIFLVERLTFNQRVINAKATTIHNLDVDNTNVSTLATNVKALETNQSLINLKAHPDDNAVQVILDALPSDANSSALGGALQNLLNVPGLSLDSLTVTPVAGIETGVSAGGAAAVAAAPTTDATGATVDQNVIAFSLSVSGSQDSVKQLLTNFEKSIRTIDVLSFQITAASLSSNLTLDLSGQAHYQPGASIKLEQTEVK